MFQLFQQPCIFSGVLRSRRRQKQFCRTAFPCCCMQHRAASFPESICSVWFHVDRHRSVGIGFTFEEIFCGAAFVKTHEKTVGGDTHIALCGNRKGIKECYSKKHTFQFLIPQTKKRTALTLSASSFYSCRISASGISSSSGFSGGTMSRISNQNVEPSPSLLLTP